MRPYHHLRSRITQALVLAAMMLGLAGIGIGGGGGAAPVRAQDIPAEPAGIASQIAIQPDGRDAEIAARLAKIMDASGWFSELEVSVREGIVFLDGRTETERRREWAHDVALRTQDVVAVVNRIEVQRPISWDPAPAWHETARLVERILSTAPLVIASLVIFVIFWFLSLAAARLSRRTLERRLASILLADIAARAIALLVFLVGLYLVLQIAGLTRLAVTVLGGTGLLGIIIGLAFREIAENSLASILLSARNPFRVGDLIQLGEYQGIVQNLNMRTTILMTPDGNHIQIPNSLVFKSVITNFTSNPNRRGEFTVGIGYPDSIRRAQELIIATLKAHPAVLDDPEPNVIVDELAESTVNLRVHFWLNSQFFSLIKVRSSLLRQVKLALQNAGVSMPSPGYEIIFPEGVPLRPRLLDDAPPQGGSPADAQARLASGAAEPDAEDDMASEGAAVSAGEGNLKSEAGDLERQAQGSDVPEAQSNLLVPNEPSDQA
ncbi:MAG: mechanosensitive ion channel domain-containing protein [Erythrobacter sp.]